MKFQQAIHFTLRWEGGTNYSVYDRGGLTRFGISKKQYPNLDIEDLSLEEAIEIYRRDYWDACNCDQLPQPIATVLFDSAVNCGQGSAVKWLQKALGNVTVDGLLGPETLGAVAEGDPYSLASKLMAYRLERYSKLITREPSQRAFILGWLNRAIALLLYI